MPTLLAFRTGVIFKLLMLSVCAWIAQASATPAPPLSIIYPQPESQTDARSQYPREVLKLALDKNGQPYTLQMSKLKMTQNRALAQLSSGDEITVYWSMTSRQREQDLLPIRIPLDKGLLGWRIFLIHKKNEQAFSHLQTLQQLKQFEAGQGHDWPDTEILRANGLHVQGIANYEGLFKMLEMGVIDYFPRSVMEIWQEEKNHAAMGIQVEPSILLHYPTAQYFFVSKNNHALAKALENGLHKAIADGSFEQLFLRFHGDILAKARLKQRRHLHLNNPLLPPETPLREKRFWLNVAD